MTPHFPGLVAATPTPFTDQGDVNLAVVERQAEHLLAQGVAAVFIAGTTGECHSLTVAERRALTQRWLEVARGTRLRVVVHVGSNCLADAKELAEHAQACGAAAIAALAPSYFKPGTLADLVAVCRALAAAAPATPFFYYDIPSMTGLHQSMPAFLDLAADQIPTLVGLKFSNPDLMAFQHCLHVRGGRFEVLFGVDEYLLAALVLGGTGAVGSSYNVAGPLFDQLFAALARGDMAAARAVQWRVAQGITFLGRFGYLAGLRALLEFLGVPVGPPRLPLRGLDPEQQRQLLSGLAELGILADLPRL
jgi:N-acetylneuraminate lyase